MASLSRVSCRVAVVERSVPPSARRTFSVTHASPRAGVPSESAVITFPPVAMLREHSLSVLVLAIGQPYCEDCVVTRLHSSSHCRGLVSVTLKAKPRHGQDGIICSPPTPPAPKATRRLHSSEDASNSSVSPLKESLHMPHLFGPSPPPTAQTKRASARALSQNRSRNGDVLHPYTFTREGKPFRMEEVYR